MKEFGKVQRYAMLKATGCMRSTSTEMLEALTNITRMDLHLRLKQAQEVVCIASKHEGDPIRHNFDEYLVKPSTKSRHQSIFDLLVTRFNELNDCYDVENDTKYSLRLRRLTGNLKHDEFKKIKEMQH